jgi:hypothetical protein
MRNKFLVFSVQCSIFLLLLNSGYLSPVTKVKAQTPATQSAQQIRDAVQKKVQEQLSNIKQAVSRKAFIGNVTSKSETEFVLTNLKNQTRTVTVTGDTVIKLSSGKEGTITDLKTNDFLLAIGDVDSQNKMTGKRILILKQPEADNREIMFANVTKITSSVLTVENAAKETWTIKLSSSTNVTNILDNKVTKTKVTNIEVGDKVVLVGTSTTSENTLTGRAIHILP